MSFEYPYGSHESLYRATNNPLYVWREIENCYLNNESFPNWVVAYLGEAAFKLRRIEKPSTNSNREILEALGIQRTSIFNDQFDEDAMLKESVYKDMLSIKFEKSGVKKNQSVESIIAGQLRKSEKTIKKWCKEFEESINKLNSPLLPEAREEMIRDMVRSIRNEKFGKRKTLYKFKLRNASYYYQSPVPISIIKNLYKEACFLADNPNYNTEDHISSEMILRFKALQHLHKKRKNDTNVKQFGEFIQKRIDQLSHQ